MTTKERAFELGAALSEANPESLPGSAYDFAALVQTAERVGWLPLLCSYLCAALEGRRIDPEPVEIVALRVWDLCKANANADYTAADNLHDTTDAISRGWVGRRGAGPHASGCGVLESDRFHRFHAAPGKLSRDGHLLALALLHMVEIGGLE